MLIAVKNSPLGKICGRSQIIVKRRTIEKMCSIIGMQKRYLLAKAVLAYIWKNKKRC
jgi:hypothetical protein